MTTPEDDRPPRLARRMYLRFALAAIVLVFATAGATATAVLLDLDRSADIFISNSKPIEGIEGVLDDVDPGDPQTILVLGSDRRFADKEQGNPVRSDTIILVRLNPDADATTIMSLPRDLKVAIPGYRTDKINAAYALGGPALTAKTVRQLLGIPINHVVSINFGGFQRLINRLGCVYTDVDRRYLNTNDPPFASPTNYATIDIQAGYQRLCGGDSLDYVRYRHLDTDFVRAARQQDYLRQAKGQIGTGKLFSDRNTLLRLVALYTETDIRSTNAILRLLRLGILSAKNPLQEVQFPGEISGAYVVASERDLQRSVDAFMHPERQRAPSSSSGTSGSGGGSSSGGSRSSRRAAALPAGIVESARVGEDEAARLAAKLDFAVFYPKTALRGSQLLVDDSRAYELEDRSRRRWPSYRIVVKAPGLGQYYGIQGTTWRSAPILNGSSEKRRLGGRTFELHYDGRRLRLVAWRTPKAVYWISNTLSEQITNQQMLALARSVARVG